MTARRRRCWRGGDRRRSGADDVELVLEARLSRKASFVWWWLSTLHVALRVQAAGRTRSIVREAAQLTLCLFRCERPEGPGGWK